MLEKWENAVMKINNNGQVWRATRYSFICNHFERLDYIVPPTTAEETCRLKKNAVPSVFSILDIPNSSDLSDTERRRLGLPRKRSLSPDESDSMSPAAKILREHNYARCNEGPQDDENLTEDEQGEEPDRSELQQKLRQKIKGLQQQLRRSKKKLQSMKDLILHLQEKLVISTEQAGILHAAFDNLQLSIFQNAKDNLSSTPTGRRYSDEVKEFARTLYFYSPKAYRYVRSIIPLPNQSLLRKWSSSVNCEPGFFKEAFTALASEVSRDAIKKDCYLLLMLWPSENKQYETQRRIVMLVLWTMAREDRSLMIRRR